MGRLAIVLGDQLDRHSPILDALDPAADTLWMAEAAGEADHVFSHKARIAVFLAAMRHFREEMRERGLEVLYHELDPTPSADAAESLGALLAADIARVKPEALRVVHPGEYRVLAMLREVAHAAGLDLDVIEDTHFYCTLDEFQAWLARRKQPRMEHFYREMRKRHDVLMEGSEPAGGRWNYDDQNRKTFGKGGPKGISAPPEFKRDEITQAVLELVERRFPDHPGALERFNWPVTPAQARAGLNAFIDNRLADFGRYQDAMWTGEPFLNHALLSSALNLKLLSPREVIDRVLKAYHERDLPLASVEGFVRQVLGWREYVRGIYWAHMPEYIDRNALEAREPLPAFYWTADTEMTCLAESIGQTLEYGYAHHIQRLMVTGLFALMLGVAPREVHAWYLAVYVDAVEWVELPNTLGMSQYGDGGLLASKPYVASGKYVQRMSNYCSQCRFDPAQRTGSNACPFTTLFWDFLIRHEARFADHPRTGLMWRNLRHLDEAERKEVTESAASLRHRLRDGDGA